jgi:hypothetical protein
MSSKDTANPNACPKHQDVEIYGPYGQRGCVDCADMPVPAEPTETDTTSELRQQIQALTVFKAATNLHQQSRSNSNNLERFQADWIAGIEALLAAQKQRWEAEARIEELRHVDPRARWSGEEAFTTVNGRLGSLMSTAAGLDGVIGTEETKINFKKARQMGFPAKKFIEELDATHGTTGDNPSDTEKKTQ